MNTFQELGLDTKLIHAITNLGFEQPSEVQAQAIPLLLSQQTDLVALAQTGTGKTAAFGLPMLQNLIENSKTTQGLVISPTRELCLQITEELKRYSTNYEALNVVAVYGGANITEQAKKIKRGAQIVVATPGRLKDMIKRKMVDISQVDYVVLDEADEMLNMGFYEDITAILSHTPTDKSTWLFSATMPKEVAKIAKKFMKNPAEIAIGAKNIGAESVSHEYYVISARDRYLALKRLADANPDIFSVVFCRTKRDTQKVAEKLISDGYNAGALHGDLSQNQRDLVMKAFRTKQIQMLVATDVAARGIDVDDISHVINYQLPDEDETYTHRSGRTGRAGKKGISMVLVSKSELRKIKALEKVLQKTFQKKTIPNGIEICDVQLRSLAHKIHQTEINHEIDNYIDEINTLFENTSKDELIKKVFSVEFSRFFNYYKDTKDLNAEAKSSSERDTSNEKSTRFFINVGKKDGFTWMSLKDLLREFLQLKKDDIFKVDVLDSFSFFNVESHHQQNVINFFKDFKYKGRFVNVEISDAKPKRNRKDRRRKGKQSKRSRR